MTDKPEDLLRQIGQRIVELRRRKGLTQAKFAEKLGNVVQWVSRVEVGDENLTVFTLSRLARALGVKVRVLFDEPGPEVPMVRAGRPRKPR